MCTHYTHDKYVHSGKVYKSYLFFVPSCVLVQEYCYCSTTLYMTTTHLSLLCFSRTVCAHAPSSRGQCSSNCIPDLSGRRSELTNVCAVTIGEATFSLPALLFTRKHNFNKQYLWLLLVCRIRVLCEKHINNYT